MKFQNFKTIDQIISPLLDTLARYDNTMKDIWDRSQAEVETSKILCR